MNPRMERYGIKVERMKKKLRRMALETDQDV
jgi:hypothetical protein